MLIKTKSENETQELAKALATKYRDQSVLISLQGDLGTGKTTFAKGFADGLGIKHRILSPTFVITRLYEIPATQRIFYHIDLYRFEDNFDTISSGIQELLENNQDIILIEWPEKLGNKLPHRAIRVTLKRVSENEREINVDK